MNFEVSYSKIIFFCLNLRDNKYSDDALKALAQVTVKLSHGAKVDGETGSVTFLLYIVVKTMRPMSNSERNCPNV